MTMSFTSLTADKTTVGSIKSWQNYSKMDAEGILEEAQSMIYMRLRCREMKTSDQFAVKAGAASYDLPEGFLDPIMVKDITNDVEIDYKDELVLENMRVWSAGVMSSGDPAAYGVYDEAFNFDVKSTAAWTMRVMFYKTPDALSTGNSTNFLTKRYPHLVRMACLATGARFAHDNEIFVREQGLLFKEIDEMSVTDEFGRSTEVPVEI